jgi:hypothetical protein
MVSWGKNDEQVRENRLTIGICFVSVDPWYVPPNPEMQTRITKWLKLLYEIK